MRLFDLRGKKITDILAENRFTLSVEIVPLRNGKSYGEILGDIGKLSTLGIDFASVTKGAGGGLRGGSLPLSYFITQRFGINSIAHFTCMERTKEQIETELVDYHLFGIKNILALRGDLPVGNNSLNIKSDYEYAWQLVRQINSMNNGIYLKRAETEKGTGERTDFCIGVAAYPSAPNIDEQIAYLAKKVDEGAEYALTQMIFDSSAYFNYLDKCKESGINIPIIPGIRPIVNRAQCEFSEKFFGLKIPNELKNAVTVNDQAIARENGLEYAIGLCDELKRNGAPGLHLFVINDIKAACEIITSLRKKEENAQFCRDFYHNPYKIN